MPTTSHSDGFDEQSLEAELREGARARSRSGWDWLNKPITLWALTTVAVGLLSFTYSQYSSCNQLLDADSSRFEKLLSELGVRGGTLYGVAVQTQTEATPDAMLSVLNPDEVFLYSEFKGKSVAEIIPEARLMNWARALGTKTIELAQYDEEIDLGSSMTCARRAL